MTESTNINTASLQSTVPPKAEGVLTSTDSDNRYGEMPCSLQGLLYEAMSTMSNFEIEQMKQFLAYMTASAAAYGGLTQHSDGTISINLKSDGTVQGGLIGTQIQLSFKSAEEQKRAMESQAKGYLGQAIMSGVAVAGMGVSGFMTRTKPLENEQAMHSKFGAELNKPAKGDDIMVESLQAQIEAKQAIQNPTPADKEALASLTAKKAEREAMQAKIKQVAADRTATEAFAKEHQDPLTNDATKQFNEAMVNHMKRQTNNKELDAVRAHNDKIIDQKAAQINAKNQQFANATNLLNVVDRTGGNIAQGIQTMRQASETAESAKSKANADAVTALNQQIYQTSIAAAKQQASDKANDASQIAGAYAQTKV